MQAQAKGGCDDPDCDCGGGGGGGPDGVVAISASVSLHTSIVCLYKYLYRCGTNQFKSILEFLETMEDEIGNITEKVEDLSASHKVHEKRCDNDNVITTNKLNAMNDKVLEIRQLTGVNASSQRLANLLNEMKRKAIIDENGFTIPIEDQKPQDETIEDMNERSALDDDNKSTRSHSKAKIISLSEEADFVRDGKDTSSNSSESFGEKVIERPRGARNKTRTHSESSRNPPPGNEKE